MPDEADNVGVPNASNEVAGRALATGAPERLRRLPTWLLTQVRMVALQHLADALRTPGRRSDYSVLASLAESGPASQAELGRRLGLDRKDAALICARLERSGHVERGPDPTDPRRNRVVLTASGTAELEAADRDLAQAQAALLEPLDAGERAQLVALLQRVLDHHRPVSPARSGTPGDRTP